MQDARGRIAEGSCNSDSRFNKIRRDFGTTIAFPSSSSTSNPDAACDRREAANCHQQTGTKMKTLLSVLTLALGLTFVGCDDSVYDERAEDVRDTTQQYADDVRENYDNAAENIEDRYESARPAWEDQAEEKADNLEDRGEQIADQIEAEGEQRADQLEEMDDNETVQEVE